MQILSKNFDTSGTETEDKEALLWHFKCFIEASKVNVTPSSCSHIKEHFYRM